MHGILLKKWNFTANNRWKFPSTHLLCLWHGRDWLKMKKILSFILTAVVTLSAVCSAAGETNALPSVRAEVEKSMYEYGETVILSYGADDADGEIRSLALYLNGEKHMDLPVGAGVAELGVLQPGSYRAAVEAADNLGGIGKAAATFVVRKTEETLISFDDFEEEAKRDVNWKVTNVAAVYQQYTGASDPDSMNGYSFYLKSAGTVGRFISQQAITDKMNSGDITVEFDILASGADTGNNIIYLHHPAGDGWYTDFRYDRIDWVPMLQYNSDDGVIKQKLPIDTWYTLKYTFNIKEKTTSASYKVKGEESYHLLGKRTNINIGDTLIDFRLELNGYGGYSRYIDNVKVTKSNVSPYAEEPKFYIDEGAEGSDLDHVPPGANKIVVGFSAEMDADTINADTVTITKEGEAAAVTSVQYDKAAKAATVILTQSLLSNTQYTIRISDDIKAASGAPLANAQRYTFKTGYKDFDCTGVRAYVNNSLVSMSDIKAGDTVDFEYFVQNKTQETKSGYLIFVAYEKGMMRFADIQNVSIESGAEMKVIRSAKSYTASAAPDCIEVYFWTELVGGKNLLTPQAIQ